MYFIKSEELKDDKGVSVTMYGLGCKNHTYSAITSDIKKISLLCDLCNELELDEAQLGDVIEDFLVSLT